MTVSEKMDALLEAVNVLKDKYCENCQQYDCYMCPYQIKEEQMYFPRLEWQRSILKMNKYECLVRSHDCVQKIIRWFSSDETAYAWLELEGYKVIMIRRVRNTGGEQDDT